MPLTRGVAIVDQPYVETITHEVGLDQLDDDLGGSAKLAGALLRATDLIIIDLIARDSIDPTKIGNDLDLKPAAAWLAAWIVLDAQEGDEYKTRAKRCLERYVDQLAKYRYVSNDPSDTAPIRDHKGHMRVATTDNYDLPGRTREGSERRRRHFGNPRMF